MKRIGVAIMAAWLTWSHAGSADEYPTGSVTIVVPFASGASTDIVARFVAQELSIKLGKPVVVENKPGAGSVVGSVYVARSQPDGHTLLMATLSSVATNLTVYKSLPYNPRADFTPLATVAKIPFLLVANDHIPIKSIPELIAHAKANPERINMGSAGPGSAHHLFAELFASMAGIKFTHVPYRGSLPALNGLLTNSIDMTFTDLPPAQGMLQSGKVRALAVTTATRIPQLPDVPTFGESGDPGYDAAAWFMMLTPAKTPKSVTSRLHRELQAILASAGIRDRIVAMSLLPMETLSVADLERFVQAEIGRWSEIIQTTGLAGSQ